jgi:hypothetical protein
VHKAVLEGKEEQYDLAAVQPVAFSDDVYNRPNTVVSCASIIQRVMVVYPEFHLVQLIIVCTTLLLGYTEQSLVQSKPEPLPNHYP